MDYGLRAAWEIAPFAAMLVFAIVALAAANREKRLLWFFIPLLLSEAFLIAASTVRYDSSQSAQEFISLAYLGVMAALSTWLVIRTEPNLRLAAFFLAVLTMLYAVLVTLAAFVTDS